MAVPWWKDPSQSRWLSVSWLPESMLRRCISTILLFLKTVFLWIADVQLHSYSIGRCSLGFLPLPLKRLVHNGWWKSLGLGSIRWMWPSLLDMQLDLAFVMALFRLTLRCCSGVSPNWSSSRPEFPTSIGSIARSCVGELFQNAFSTNTPLFQWDLHYRFRFMLIQDEQQTSKINQPEPIIHSLKYTLI